MHNHIEKVLKGTNTKIVQGNGYLKVKPLGIKLNKLIDLFLEKIISHSLIDFIYYLGNGQDDEQVFEYLKSQKVSDKYLSPECTNYICTLEKKPSEANYYIEEED